MKARDQFDDLIRSSIVPLMRERGFSRRGNNFHLRRDGNWGVINFQKSTRQIPAALMFTVNIGVSSKLLSDFYGDPKQARAPSVWDCHWSERIGLFLPDRDDKWWLIGEGIDTENTVKELMDKVRDVAIPTVLKHVEDRELRDFLLRRFDTRVATMRELMNLTVLLKVLGPTEPLEGVVRELEELAAKEPELNETIKPHFKALENWADKVEGRPI